MPWRMVTSHRRAVAKAGTILWGYWRTVARSTGKRRAICVWHRAILLQKLHTLQVCVRWRISAWFRR